MTNTVYRDRTTEFRSVTETLKRSASIPKTQNQLRANGDSSFPPDTQIRSAFNAQASRIGIGIQEASLSISRLAQVAKRSSMFDDPSVEINELTVIIKNKISALNASLSDLQAIRKTELSSEQAPMGHSVEHANAVCEDLKGKLMSITKRLKEVLTTRTENMKAHENRKQLFSSTATFRDNNSNVKAFMRQSNASAYTLPWSSSASVVAPSPETTPLLQNHTLVNNQLRRRSAGESGFSSELQLSMLQEQVPQQENYSRSRTAALHSVESTITELSGIFTNLATMVVHQGEVAIRIDDNMDESLAHVENARSALLRHFNRISSNRSLLIKIFAIIIIFMMIFIIFIA